MATLIKEHTELGLAYRFSGLVHYHYSREHVSRCGGGERAESSTSKSSGSSKRQTLGMAWAFENQKPHHHSTLPAIKFTPTPTRPHLQIPLK